MLRLATIGYAGTSLAGFIDALAGEGVRTLVDVRAVPASRRPAFSKRALARALGTAGIAYRHLPALGNPAEGRAAARQGRIADYRRIFAARLGEPSARDALAEIAGLMDEAYPCLLCLEYDPARCHRMMVANALTRMTGVAARHLMVRPGDRRQLPLDL
ncbi:MAG TPA: DUF488 domain-containing protein [Thermoanaerobaculia bacterium]|jgi:uncharacterized protein (DUF488 family)